EVMSIGKTYKEAFQKAIRSLETGRYGLGFAADYNKLPLEELLELLKKPTSQRQFIMYEALRKGADTETLFELTKIKRWFIEQMRELVAEEQVLLARKGSVPERAALESAKKNGFSDKYLSQILDVPEKTIRDARVSYGIKEAWEGVHVSGTQDSAYYFSTYNAPDKSPVSTGKPKVMILGGGPNRIGQGIEFDYCCVHAAKSLKKLGFETIMVNCNPETVSTDYDTSDKLYFEPLTTEDVLSIYEKEQPAGVIVQFGGQTPLNIAAELKENGVNILGTPPEVIAMAEDRDLFREMMEKLDIPMPEAGMAVTAEEAVCRANEIGYPVMVRPSYVLGGRGMEIVYDDEHLEKYMLSAVGVTPDRPILIDRFLRHATECEADAICDGEHAFVPAVMEHIELAGIHSGDSACVIPSKNISEANLMVIREYTKKIAEQMGVKGLMNIQYAIENGKVYVIEANPRASRTVPLVSKVCDVNMVPTAVEIITAPLTGSDFSVSELKERNIPYYGVKEAVLPFNMFPEVDPVLGPEMRSTGEVLAISTIFGKAFVRAQEATGSPLPLEGTVLISVNDKDKPELDMVAGNLTEAGYKLMATGKTYEYLLNLGYEVERIASIEESGRPNCVDAMLDGRVQLIINTPSGHRGNIRREAISCRIPYITTMAAAKAAALGLKEKKTAPSSGVMSIQDWHRQITYKD
ncbi:MAG: carbamoyl-phosphate synthase large subunit, partial [Oscillospiraceae bacterium]|nr:carbamoyl-phosphate synthase large subunit [Oscillospiraceae bacterium]